jgi:hypothetical protein
MTTTCFCFKILLLGHQLSERQSMLPMIRSFNHSLGAVLVVICQNAIKLFVDLCLEVVSISWIRRRIRLELAKACVRSCLVYKTLLTCLAIFTQQLMPSFSNSTFKILWLASFKCCLNLLAVVCLAMPTKSCYARDRCMPVHSNLACGAMQIQ